MIYFESDSLLIRSMEKSDARVIYDTYLSYNWHPVLETYETYYRENLSGRRITFCAEVDGKLAGHVSLILAPDPGEMGPFAGSGMPLVSDFTVFFAYHRRGIGKKLMDVLEGKAAELADGVCLAVGCHYGYGTAQRMYIKRGYIPDGSGVWWNGKRHEQYEPCVNDDELLLWLSKDLSKVQKI